MGDPSSYFQVLRAPVNMMYRSNYGLYAAFVLLHAINKACRNFLPLCSGNGN